MTDEVGHASPASADTAAPAEAAPATAADNPFSSFSPEIQEWATSKGFKDVGAALHSGWSASKMVGVDKNDLIRVPRDGDTEGFNALYDKLGRPASPEEYEFAAPEGAEVDSGFRSAMASAMHEAGLTKAQAAKVAEAYAQHAMQDGEQTEEQYNLSVQAAEQELKQVWGRGYQRQESLAQAAVQEYQIPAEAIDAIESSIGYAQTMMLMARLGQSLGEDSFVASESPSGGMSNFSTPGQAKAAFQNWAAQNQEALFDKSHPRHKQALAEKSNFFKMMHGG